MEQLSPQLLERLRLLAAREVLHQVATTEMVRFANEALNTCVFDDLLLAIVDARPSTRAQILPPFTHYCEKQGIRISNQDDARLVLFAHYVERMADASFDPIMEFDAFLTQVQTEGALKLESDLVRYAEEIGSLLFTEVKYNWEFQKPSPSDGERLRDYMAVQIRDAARRILAKDDHNLIRLAVQASTLS